MARTKSVTLPINTARELRETDREEGPRWTFLTNHAHVLILLHADPGLLLREVAARVGITERAVQRILQELEEAGVVQRERIGRRNQYEIRTDVPLRHPIEAHCSVADLLKLIVGKGRTARGK